MKIWYRRHRLAQNRGVSFNCLHFEQHPALLPSTLNSQGEFRVFPHQQGSRIVMKQKTHTSRPVSWLYGRIVEKKLYSYFKSVGRYLGAVKVAKN